MAGRSGRGKPAGAAAAGGLVAASDSSVTSPTNRTPLRAMVRISRCSTPLSSTARRAALIRLVSVDSETTRPFQIASSRLSRVTTRSRLRTR